MKGKSPRRKTHDARTSRTLLGSNRGIRCQFICGTAPATMRTGFLFASFGFNYRDIHQMRESVIGPLTNDGTGTGRRKANAASGDPVGTSRFFGIFEGEEYRGKQWRFAMFPMYLFSDRPGLEIFPIRYIAWVCFPVFRASLARTCDGYCNIVGCSAVPCFHCTFCLSLQLMSAVRRVATAYSVEKKGIGRRQPMNDSGVNMVPCSTFHPLAGNVSAMLRHVFQVDYCFHPRGLQRKPVAIRREEYSVKTQYMLAIMWH